MDNNILKLSGPNLNIFHNTYRRSQFAHPIIATPINILSSKNL